MQVTPEEAQKRAAAKKKAKKEGDNDA